MSSFTYSASLQALQQALQQNKKPESYQSRWEEALQKAMQSLAGRESFRYDPGQDPLYQSYREKHIADGRMAMLDTLGKTQAMTGGYGNSYAQNAAQQAYQGSLQSLNAVLPELYQLALSRYDRQGQQLKDQLSLLQDQEAQDYSRWQDTLDAWQAQQSLLSGQFNAQRDFEYSAFRSDRDYQLALQQEQAQQQRWQAEFDQALRQFEASQAKSASSGGGSYSGNAGYDAATVRKAQEFVGTAADGLWGKNSKAAAKAKGYGSLAEVIAAMGKPEETPVYIVSDVSRAVQSLAENGTDPAKINAYIARMTVEGKLTAEEAARLRRQYIPPKYYY